MRRQYSGLARDVVNGASAVWRRRGHASANDRSRTTPAAGLACSRAGAHRGQQREGRGQRLRTTSMRSSASGRSAIVASSNAWSAATTGRSTTAPRTGSRSSAASRTSTKASCIAPAAPIARWVCGRSTRRRTSGPIGRSTVATRRRSRSTASAVSRTASARSSPTTRSQASRSACAAPSRCSLPASMQWEQAFSPDGGRTWETNYVMHHTRI